MKITNKKIWLVLVILTIASFITSKEGFVKDTSLIIIVILSAFKFISIGFQFMELKHAHIFWQIFFSGIIIFYVILVFSISLQV